MSKRRATQRDPVGAPPRQIRLVALAILTLALAAALIALLPLVDRDGKRSLEPFVPQLNSVAAPADAPQGMQWIPGGSFWMGSADGLFADAQPLTPVYVDGFWMDATPVTNAKFDQFVRETRYRTVAERQPDAANYPGEAPEELVPGSIVFSPPAEAVSLDNYLAWWRYVPGADWRHPEGPDSNLEGRERYPVVHICWEDAVAYAKWAGKRLPTEAEFEFAARGGLDRQPYAWGSELLPGGKWQANVWQGTFPTHNSAEDGFPATSPVASFPANAYGLHDMSGNVWQWCSDWYRPDTYRKLSRARRTTGEPPGNPQGPAESYDPQEPGLQKRVQRGGSFLCSTDYCVRYRVAGRGKGAIDSGSSNVGFRCVRSPGGHE